MVEVKSLEHTRLVLMAKCTPTDTNVDAYTKYYRGTADGSRNMWSESLAEAIVYTNINDVRKIIRRLVTKVVEIDELYVDVKLTPKLMSKKEIMVARIKG